MAESYISELGDKLSHGVANTDGSRVKIIAPKLYTDGNSHPSIATALAGKAASSHTHGNIANGGTLTDTAAAAAGNDYVVIRDADNAKIQTSTIKGTDVADAVSKKHSHSTLTLSTTAQAYDGTHTLALPSTDPYTSARTPASHTHGNIQNGGTLQTTDVTIASGDKLVVTDASDSNKVARTSVSFDGSTTGQLLSKAGTFQNPKEAYLEWGGRNITGTYSPIDAAMIPVLGACRTAFGKPAGITVEYTRDGGTTWIDYGLTDNEKTGLFTTSVSITIGKASSTNKATADENWSQYKLRVIITNPAFGLYTNINKFAVYLSTNGSDGAKMTVYHMSRTTEEAGGSWSSLGTMNVGGWSGWNIFNTNVTTWSGSSGQKDQSSKIMLLFEATQASTESHKQCIGLTITKIYGYGGVGWAVPSTYAATGNIYSFDVNQNVTFPAKITATAFSGNATSATKLATARKLAVSLSNTSTDTSFDGSADVTNIKVSGTLPVANGGTGQTSLASVTVGTATKATQDSDGNAINATYFKSSGNTTLVSGSATKIGTQNGTDVKLTLPAIPAAVSVKGNAESSYRTGQVNLTPANLGISATTSSVTVGSTTFNNTDTKVKATAKTDNVNYKILATASASPTSGSATEAVYDTDITLNPSTNTIAANISGNAAAATTADSVSTAIGSGEIKLLGVANNVAGNYQPKMHPTIRAWYNNDNNGNILMIGPERGTRGAADRGGIRLSGGTGYYTQLQTADFTADRWHKLPDESGNLAITSGTYPNMSVGTADYASAAKSGSALAQAIAPDADVELILYGDSTYSSVKALYNAGKKLYLVTGGSIQPSGRFEYRIPLTLITYDANLEVNAFYFEQPQDDRAGASEVGSIAVYRLDSAGWTTTAKQVGYAVNAGAAVTYTSGGGIDTALQDKMATNGSNATNVAGGNIIRNLNDWTNPGDAEMIAAASSSEQGKYTLVKLWDNYFKNKVNQIIPNVGYMGAPAMTAMQKNGTDTMPGNVCKICLDPNTYYSFGYNGFTCLGHYNPTGSGQKYYGWCGNFAQNGGIVEIDFDYTATVEIARGSITSLPTSMDVSFAAMTANNTFQYGFALDASTIFATAQETMRFEVSGTSAKQIKGHARLIGRGAAASTQTGTRIFVGAVQITSPDHFLVLNVNNICIKVTSGQIYDVTYM